MTDKELAERYKMALEAIVQTSETVDGGKPLPTFFAMKAIARKALVLEDTP